MLFRAMSNLNEVTQRKIMPGDIMAGGESALAGAISTVGAGTWTAAAIATGIINRSGPVANYTDTTDTAANIIAALLGTGPAADVAPGTSFRLIVQNTVAQTLTFAAGTGVTAGNGTLNIAASLVREYLVTILNNSPLQTYQMTGNNAQPYLYFGYNVGVAGAAPTSPTVIPLVGSNGPLGTMQLSPGAIVNSGTNVAANATVIGIIMGQGGAIGLQLSSNNTGAVNGPVTFGPNVKFDSIGTMGL